MILQMPDDMGDPPPEKNAGFAYLMQFTDGNRIDLNLFPVDRLSELEDGQPEPAAADKDGLFGQLPQPSESSYLPQLRLLKPLTTAATSSGGLPVCRQGLVAR